MVKFSGLPLVRLHGRGFFSGTDFHFSRSPPAFPAVIFNFSFSVFATVKIDSLSALGIISPISFACAPLESGCAFPANVRTFVCLI